MKKGILEELQTNIVSWYDFEKNSKILYCEESEDAIYEYLKRKDVIVDLYKEKKNTDTMYDYIVILKEKIDINKLKEMLKKLKDDGIILLAFNNSYGISKFVTYNYSERISPLEQVEESTSRHEIEEFLKENGYKVNIYMPFPNWKITDLILTNKIEDISQKIDKYFVSYNNNCAILVNEINLLKRIAKYDKEMFINLANSYLLEISKKQLNTDVRYVSFNNYRKNEYQLTTIIRDNIVEKRPTTKEASKNIERIAKNIEHLQEYDFEILDRFKDNKLYSSYVKDRPTLDVELGLKYNDKEFVINKFNEIKQILLKNSLKYDKKYNQYFINTLKKQKKETLEELNYLEYAFYDMVPKNCFYIDGKYYFFDQEWMKKYLPVEFIIYRSVINSYDLVKKIDVDDLLEKIGLKQYRKMFEEMDEDLRKDILDMQKFNELSKNYKKMYELIYENEVLKIQNAAYKENDSKQNEYIKQLETKINKRK